MLQVLDKIVLEAISGTHRHFSAICDLARRYAPGFSPIVGFQDRSKPGFDVLAEVYSDGESIYTEGWTGSAPHGWRDDFEAIMFKMIWEGELPTENPAHSAIRLPFDWSGDHEVCISPCPPRVVPA